MPPRKIDPIQGSYPMVPAHGRVAGTPNPHLERPMQSDMIDLVFGRPLVQEIDFELPFGGAVFRHVRTFSRQVQRSYEPWGDIGFWDWNGHGWMMGEAPILLIDAQVGLSVDGSFDNIVSIVGTDVHTMPERRCVLVPDAHHAIPFILQQHGQEYDDILLQWLTLPFKTGLHAKTPQYLFNFKNTETKQNYIIKNR
ncbi:MAG TPA: hypothetical protein P5572_20030, partial [Phycisphaerae bacterium]|nr:hypothetical protein [Phycisphaerae bacterium]